MSELPHTDPDLHAIFGIDGSSDEDRVISVERGGMANVELDVEHRSLPGVSEHIELEPDLQAGLETLPEADPQVELGRIAGADLDADPYPEAQSVSSAMPS